MEESGKKCTHPEEFEEKMLEKMHLYSFSQVRESRRFNKLLENFDVPYQTYQVLSLLLSNPDGIEPSKIADTFSILRQTVTNIADAMEKLGYLERVRSSTDRRSIYLRLLPKGIEATSAMKNEIESFHKRVMVNFTPEELETYFDFRRKLLKCLDEEMDSTMKSRAESSTKNK